MRIISLFLVALATTAVADEGAPVTEAAPTFEVQGAAGAEVMTWRGMKPGARVTVLASTTGAADGACLAHGDVCLGVADATAVQTVRANRDGVAVMSMPAAARGSLHVQAISHGYGVLPQASPVVTRGADGVAVIVGDASEEMVVASAR